MKIEKGTKTDSMMNEQVNGFQKIFLEVLEEGLNNGQKENKSEPQKWELGHIEVMILYVSGLDEEGIDADEVVIGCTKGLENHSLYNKVRENTEKFNPLYKKLADKEKEEICEKIKEEIDNEEKISVVKVKKIDRMISIAENTNLVIGIVLKKEKEGYVGIIEYVLSELMEKIEADTELEDLKKIEKYLNPFRKNWRLMREYVEYYLENYHLPPADRLNELASSRYEGSESEARIYFKEDGSIPEEIQIVSALEHPKEEERIIHSKKHRMIRKMMELSKMNVLYLLSERKIVNESEEFVITDLVQEKPEVTNKKARYIKFSGFLCWSIMEGNREVLTYRNGIYEGNYSKQDKPYMQELKKLRAVADFEMMEDLVGILKKQKHGTIAILSECRRKEIKRFCDTNRAIYLKTALKYEKNFEGKMTWNEKQLLSLTCVDGALFMDFEGNCWAFSVLLDGEAKIKGDVGRGSRFNSVKNYIEQKDEKKEGTYIGIVISEDGMINIISNHKL